MTSADLAGATTPGPDPIPPAAFAAFQVRLGYEFAVPALLGRALTHRSWCAEHAGYVSNERLEFLGDAVLGLIVTDDLYRQMPDTNEGQLSRLRATVVCATALAEMATDLGLGEVLLLGKGEAATGGRERSSILADAMEAVVGAVHLDGGPEAASALVRHLVTPRLAGCVDADHKSRLQELTAKEPGRAVIYRITEDGPEHDKRFEATAVVDDVATGRGVGRSKKQAEQAAARDAWQRLATDRGTPPAREEPSHG